MARYFRRNRGLSPVSTKKALDSKAVRATFEQEAMTAVGDSPDEFGAHVKREIARYAEIIRKGNITVQ